MAELVERPDPQPSHANLTCQESPPRAANDSIPAPENRAPAESSPEHAAKEAPMPTASDPEPNAEGPGNPTSVEARPLSTRRRRSRPIAPLPDLPKGADYLMPAQEAAGYLALTPNALAKWRCQGKHLPFVKIGSGKGQVRYRLRDLCQFIERSLRRSTSEEAPAKGEAKSLASASLFRLPRGKKSR